MERMQAQEALLESFKKLWPLVSSGYLEAVPARHEVYVTRAAYFSLIGKDTLQDIRTIVSDGPKYERILASGRIYDKMCQVTEFLSGWCMWLNVALEGYKLYEKALNGDSGATDGDATDGKQATDKKREKLAREENQEKVLWHAGRIVTAAQREAYAVNVVDDGADSRGVHPVLYTVLMTPCRRWWWPFKRVRKFEIIRY